MVGYEKGLCLQIDFPDHNGADFEGAIMGLLHSKTRCKLDRNSES